MLNLDKEYLYKLKSLPRGKDHQQPIDYSCNFPHRKLVVDYNANCLICICDGWLPIPVGKVKDFDSLPEVFNSDIAKILQEDVDNKKFTWCAVKHCGITNRNNLVNNYELAINIDESCNLSCPSCRREQIMYTDGPEIESKKRDLEKIASWLEKFDQPINIVLSGNGDPLASHVIRPFFNSYQPKPTQTFKLFTNGLLIKKQLEKSKVFPNITAFSISIDAGSKSVYENVRRGGSWSVLLENFDFLSEKKKNHLVSLNFAVQKNNFEDLYNFVELCRQYNFKCVIHQLDDWGTWNYEPGKNTDTWTAVNGTYLEHAVLRSDHPDHIRCIDILKDLDSQQNNFINFSPVIKRLLNN